jgi:two-component system NtrC family sensor kinase
MRPLLTTRTGLAAKLAICMVASTAALFVLFGYITLKVERRHSEQMVVQSADRITDIILRSTHYEMLHNDREALYNVIEQLGSEPGIRRIRIFNKDGRISFSTDGREVNRVVDKRAEACYGCHAQEAPLAKLNRPDRDRIFRDAEGHRVVGVIRPIENSATCSSAACHVHPANQRILGVIDADLSLEGVDAEMRRHERTLAWFTLAAMVLASLMSILFIWIVVYRPVKELIHGTHRVAGGEFGYRLPVRSSDELGDLAASFNKMSAEVHTAHQEIEERVRSKTAELEQIYKTLLTSEKMASIGKLAATVAHEINNPLFGILTYARLVLRELLKHDLPKRDELAEQLQTIERESKRCGDLVKNLLTFARQAPSHREPQSLNPIIGRAVALVRHKFNLQSIELRENLADHLPPVPCDGNQIQQVLLVLLVNAADAMQKGGEVEVSTVFDPENGQVRLLVKDNGPGIPADVLPQIFDPFFTTKTDPQRTGLGLAVARSIVEQHAGDISVRSTSGEGTEFTILLPAVSAAEEAISTPPSGVTEVGVAK